MGISPSAITRNYEGSNIQIGEDTPKFYKFRKPDKDLTGWDRVERMLQKEYVHTAL